MYAHNMKLKHLKFRVLLFLCPLSENEFANSPQMLCRNIRENRFEIGCANFICSKTFEIFVIIQLYHPISNCCVPLNPERKGNFKCVHWNWNVKIEIDEMQNWNCNHHLKLHHAPNSQTRQCQELEDFSSGTLNKKCAAIFEFAKLRSYANNLANGVVGWNPAQAVCVEAHTLLAHIPRNKFGVEGTPSQASVLPHRHCLQIYSKTPYLL